MKNKFKNAIVYNRYLIARDIHEQSLNISRLLYVNTENVAFSPTIIHLQNVIKFENIINIEKTKTEYKITIQPDIEELAKAFNIQISSDSYFPIIENSNNIENHIENCKLEFEKLIEAIVKFTRKRVYVLKDNQINLLNNCSRKNISDIKKFEEAFNYLKKTLPIKKYIVNDYFYGNKKKIEKSFTLNTIYNYTSLKELLKNFIINDNEYYDPSSFFKVLKNEAEYLINKSKEEDGDFISSLQEVFIDNCLKNRIEEINYFTDEINNNPAFNKENISKICIALDKYIEQEEAINKFVDKILNNKIK